MQPEQAVPAGQFGDGIDMGPVEVKLDVGSFSLERPGGHLRGALAEARFVYRYDQLSILEGFSIRAGYTSCASSRARHFHCVQWPA